MFLDIAKEIWDAVSEIYGEKENIARIFKLQVNINKVTKGDKPFYIYLNNLKFLWDELHQYHPLTADLEMIKKIEEDDEIFKLQVGLGKDYENIHDTILMMQPIPMFNSVCAILQRGETRRKVMMSENQDKEHEKDLSNSGGISQVAFLASNEAETTTALQAKSRSVKNKSTLFCNYYKKSNHIKEKCWLLHGRPPNRGKFFKGGGNFKNKRW